MPKIQNTALNFNRAYIVAAVLILFWLVLEARLFEIQVNKHDFYVEAANRQAEKQIKIPASKGIIYDRNLETLATNMIYYDLGVDLRLIGDKTNLARELAQRSGKTENYFRTKLNTNRNFVYLERKIAKENWVYQDIEDKSLVRIEYFRRSYPFGQYASQLIGFTDVDDIGASGIELQFEKYLRGKDGLTTIMYDALRRPSYSPEHPIKPPAKGSDIYLTIDKNYQIIVEDELNKGVRKYNARYGIAILMRPQSGKILAMAVSPGFNSNKPGASKPAERKNRAISDVFEPGSTLKVIPAAALLQEGKKKPDDIIYCENGSYNYHGHTIHDSKKYGWLTFQRVIENSSNIGMVKLVEELPDHILYKYLKNFGLGSVTGLGLNGENEGILSRPEKFSRISKGVISFGQEVGTTAIQMVNAYCAIVNNGYLMRPYIVEKIVDHDGRIISETEPERIRQAISSQAAEILRDFLVGSVERGTGTKAKISQMKIGGKTGTAQKYDTNIGKYKKGAYFASFIGFAPAEQAQFVLGIFLDEPRPSYYGGDVAAPIFKNIIENLLNLEPTSEIEPLDLILTEDNTNDLPDLEGLNIHIAEELLKGNDLDYKIEGEGDFIVGQKVEDDEIMLKLGGMQIYSTIVPDLRGLTVREALKKVDLSRFKIRINGTGKIYKQSITAGTKVHRNTVLVLTCRDS